jgi:hypothetical protein
VLEALPDFFEGLFVFSLSGQFEQDLQVLQVMVDPRPGLED